MDIEKQLQFCISVLKDKKMQSDLCISKMKSEKVSEEWSGYKYYSERSEALTFGMNMLTAIIEKNT